MSLFRFLNFAVLLIALIAVGGGARAADPGAEGVERCRTILDAAARLRCFEEATAPRIKAPPASPNGWRLVRTPRAEDAGETVSMIHTPDVMRSDPDFAGLMLRCAEHGLEVLVVVISPFEPRSRPVVTVPAGKDSVRLDAKPLPTGAALRLPDDAVGLASGPWQSLTELPIKVEDAGTSIRGIVPLAGLDAAMKTLRASCPTP